MIIVFLSTIAEWLKENDMLIPALVVGLCIAAGVFGWHLMGLTRTEKEE